MATILIVDDLAANRRFLLTLLRSQGHRLARGGGGFAVNVDAAERSCCTSVLDGSGSPE